MEDKTKYYHTDYKKITVKTADGSLLHGKVNITSKQRISDLFTKGDDPFFIMVETVSSEGEGKTYFINKEYIVWVEPEE